MTVYEFFEDFLTKYIFVGLDIEIIGYIAIFITFMFFTSVIWSILRLFRIGGND